MLLRIARELAGLLNLQTYHPVLTGEPKAQQASGYTPARELSHPLQGAGYLHGRSLRLNANPKFKPVPWEIFVKSDSNDPSRCFSLPLTDDSEHGKRMTGKRVDNGTWENQGCSQYAASYLDALRAARQTQVRQRA